MRPLLPLLLLAACNPHVRRDESKLPVDLGERFAATPESAGQAPAARWWAAFDDSELDKLMDRLLAENLDLKQAGERIIQARAVATQAGSGRWPQVTANLSAGASRVHSPSFSVGPTGPVTTIEADVVQRYDVNVGAAYEVDLWGRIEALTDAAEADVAATELERQALAITLTATLADLWFSLVEARASLDLLRRQTELNRLFLSLVEQRFAQGLSNAVEVLQQREQVERTEAQVPQFEARVAALEHQLAVLVALRPGALQVKSDAAALPELPALPAVGVPSDLLKRRPDIRATQARLAAADHRVAAAVADRFPTIRLSASTGFQADDLADLLDRWVWSIVGSVAAPIIDGGRRAAVVEQRKAQLREGVQRLGGQLLVALREVTDALVLEQRQALYLERLDAQLAVARELLDQAKARYVEGLSDYLPVLTALRAVQQAEIGRLAAQRQLVSHRIQLHRALAGDLAPPGG